ncbi:MAG: 2-amino-4-hydroxy-6-hydroxymethyldihydropteridine diphosphokinase [Acidobacteriota bacterium]|nr:MAG: 2-amino-4-hydroxy-6-hydroxymethyldihydropteridine diphosphokinase [Acidobacteriota bacterium]
MGPAYIGLGSNLGDRAANLIRGIRGIVRRGPELVACSSIYETEPVDNHDQPAFLNMVVAVEAGETSPFEMMKILLEIEGEMGRVRVIDKGPRTIDLDLLMLDDLIINGRRDGIDLTLPHPRMHQRRFVLEPLGEIAAEARHPVLKKSIRQLHRELNDDAAVTIYRQ